MRGVTHHMNQYKRSTQTASMCIVTGLMDTLTNMRSVTALLR